MGDVGDSLGPGGCVGSCELRGHRGCGLAWSWVPGEAASTGDVVSPGVQCPCGFPTEKMSWGQLLEVF